MLRNTVALTGERLFKETEGRQDKISSFLRQSTQACMEFYRQHVGFYGLHIHDALPIGLLTHPQLFQSVNAYVQVETEGSLTSGMTVADLRGNELDEANNASVYIKVDSDSFLNHFFNRILT